jgi:hypothetical protein
MVVATVFLMRHFVVIGLLTTGGALQTMGSARVAGACALR